MTKQERMYNRINKHGANLQRIFHLDGDPVTLCKKLRQQEHAAERITTAYCNGEIEGDAVDIELDKILSRVDKLINFSRAGVPVFINRDPRGYALKIRSEYVHEHSLDLERDFGGYGIIAPDFSE